MDWLIIASLLAFASVTAVLTVWDTARMLWRGKRGKTEQEEGHGHHQGQ